MRLQTLVLPGKPEHPAAVPWRPPPRRIAALRPEPWFVWNRHCCCNPTTKHRRKRPGPQTQSGDCIRAQTSYCGNWNQSSARCVRTSYAKRPFAKSALKLPVVRRFHFPLGCDQLHPRQGKSSQSPQAESFGQARQMPDAIVELYSSSINCGGGTGQAKRGAFYTSLPVLTVFLLSETRLSQRGRVHRLVSGDLGFVLQRKSDIVQAVEQAVPHELIDRKTRPKALLIAHLATFKIDGHPIVF
jgi:hypothetical protein